MQVLKLNPGDLYTLKRACFLANQHCHNEAKKHPKDAASYIMEAGDYAMMFNRINEKIKKLDATKAKIESTPK